VRDNLLLPGIDIHDAWKGVISFDSSEHSRIYLKPYAMTIEELRTYREKFASIALFSDRAKGLAA